MAGIMTTKLAITMGKYSVQWRATGRSITCTSDSGTIRNMAICTMCTTNMPKLSRISWRSAMTLANGAGSASGA